MRKMPGSVFGTDGCHAISSLIPGDRITHMATLADGCSTAVFVGSMPHPLYMGLRLVIWRMGDGSWSHDALSAQQEIQGVLDPTARKENLRWAFHTPGG